MSSVPHGGNMWKNIAIGIATTVAAYLIVHFITDRKDHKKEEREKSEANETAWKSANDYIRSASKKFESIACFSCDKAKMKNELLRELEQDCNSLRNLKDEKLVDEKMKTILDRTISRFNGLRPAFQSYFDSVIVLENLQPDAEKAIRLQKVYDEFSSTKNRLDTADAAEISKLLSDINKKYKLSLEQEEVVPEINYDQLSGEWNLECTMRMKFSDDGKVAVTINDEVINGTWKRKGDVITLTLDSDEILNYTILQLNDHFLRIQADTPGSQVLGACRV
jgi:hypothetical protein